MSRTKTVYMVITHITKPRAGVATNNKLAVSDPDNWETTENMVIVDSLSKRHQTESSIILDLINGKVVKSRFEVDSHKVFREYVDRYQYDITDALKLWALRNPDNYKTLKGLHDSVGDVDGKTDTN